MAFTHTSHHWSRVCIYHNCATCYCQIKFKYIHLSPKWVHIWPYFEFAIFVAFDLKWHGKWKKGISDIVAGDRLPLVVHKRIIRFESVELPYFSIFCTTRLYLIFQNGSVFNMNFRKNVQLSCVTHFRRIITQLQFVLFSYI